MTAALVVLGAGGFLGKAVLAGEHSTRPLKAVARTIPTDAAKPASRARWFAVDLQKRRSLDGLLERDDVVVNLAYAVDTDDASNRELIDNVIDACVQSGVARLIHCSTAVVVGATRVSRVTESVACAPVTAYERTKWMAEQCALGALTKGIDVGILRPTAIVGPGGRNLATLARSLLRDNELLTYLRASLFGRRPMHLVPVRNVAGALIHLADLPGALDGGIYNVCSDDDPDNDFQRVETIMREALGLSPRRLPLLPLPSRLLSLLLSMRGRSDTDIERIYVCDKLRATGFVPLDSVAESVRAFAEEFVAGSDGA